MRSARPEDEPRNPFHNPERKVEHPVCGAGPVRERDKIEDLLDAMERAAQSSDPFVAGYGNKRRALLRAVADLRSELAHEKKCREGWTNHAFELRRAIATLDDALSTGDAATIAAARAATTDLLTPGRAATPASGAPS